MCQNLYCSACLRTQTFEAVDGGFQCPTCRRLLQVRTRPPTRVEIRQPRRAREESVA